MAKFPSEEWIKLFKEEVNKNKLTNSCSLLSLLGVFNGFEDSFCDSRFWKIKNF